MTHYYSIQFAQAYGEGAYGTGVYSCTSTSDPGCETTTGTGTAAGGGSGTGGTTGGALADTGTMVILFASIACLIIFAAFIVRIWKRKPALQAVQADNAERARNHDLRS